MSSKPSESAGSNILGPTLSATLAALTATAVEIVPDRPGRLRVSIQASGGTTELFATNVPGSLKGMPLFASNYWHEEHYTGAIYGKAISASYSDVRVWEVFDA